jgi:8-amino-7-oxononanoate synthase
MIWEQLDAELAALKAEGLQRQRRVVQSACGARVEVEGPVTTGFLQQ